MEKDILIAQRSLKINKNLFFSIMLCLYMFARFAIFLGKPVLFKVAVLSLAPTIIVYLFQNPKIKHLARFAIFLTLLFAFLSLRTLNLLLFDIGFSVRNFLYFSYLIVINLSIAFLITHERVSSKILGLYLIFVLSFSFLCIFQGLDPNFIFEHSSRNTFSILALEAVVLFYLLKISEKEAEVVPLWPALFAFAISVWAMGRSGIISTGLLLAGAFLYNLSKGKRDLWVYFKLMVFVGFIFIIFNTFLANSFDLSLERFSRQSIESFGRATIAKHYFQQLSLKPHRYLWGYSIKDDPYLANTWNANLHNSFLKLHSFLGIVSIFLIILIFMGVYIKGRNCKFLWIIGLSLILRASTDSLYLIGPTDFLFFFFLFPKKGYIQDMRKN